MGDKLLHYINTVLLPVRLGSLIKDPSVHLFRPDSRVVGLIKCMGAQANPKQKRVLCMNKIDLVEKKKDLLKVIEEFKDLPGYDR